MAEDTVSGEDTYPPDAEDAFDVMDMEAPDAPGRPPVPRAAGVRAAARHKGMSVRAPKTKVKKAKSVSRGGGRILTQQKRRQALELRKAGASYQAIAEAMGYHDASGARKAVIKAFGEVIQEPVTELRTLQVERLNQMLMTLWPRVQQGEDGAIRTALSVMDKMDRLQGTETAPSMDINVNQTGILVIDGNKDDYISQMKKMAGIDGNGQNILAAQGSPQAQQVPLGAQLPQITAGPQYPPGMMAGQGNEDNDIVDAEVVDDRDESGTDPVRTDEAPQQMPGSPSKKKFSFGVDPTVRRGE